MKILASYYGGSRLYGLENENSDYDVRNIFIATDPSYIIGLENNDSRVVNNKEADVVSYEVRYFFKLLNKGAINVLESLFCEESNFSILTDEFKEIRENKNELINSESFFDAVSGFVYNQIRLGLDDGKKAQEGSNRDKSIQEYGFHGKPLIHALRVLESATNYFQTGYYNVKPDKNMDICLSIKNKPSFYKVSDLKLEIQEQFDNFKRVKDSVNGTKSKFNKDIANELLLKFYKPYLI